MLEQFIDIDIHQIKESYKELNNIKEAIEEERIAQELKALEEERRAARIAREAERKALEVARIAQEAAERKEAERKAQQEAVLEAVRKAPQESQQETDTPRKNTPCNNLNSICTMQAKYLKYKMKYNALKKQLNI